MECLGLVLEVPAEVLAPTPGVAEVLGNAMLAEACCGGRVLDMGTGCGINGGDLRFAGLLINRSGLRQEVVARVEKTRDGRPVEYLAYRLRW